MELLNHLLGTCGENHPNLVTLSVLFLLTTYFVGNKILKSNKN